jgi:hypothetical protein
MEYSNFLINAFDYLPEGFQKQEFSDFINITSNNNQSILYSFADYVALNMPSPREAYYSSKSYDEI